MSKIKDIKLLKAEINIMRNMPKQCELKVKRKAQISAPKEEGDRTALLNLGLSVETIESEGIKIELEADTILEFETIPEDYVKIGEEICVPMVQKEMLKRLDEMLFQMGYEKLHLSEKL